MEWKGYLGFMNFFFVCLEFVFLMTYRNLYNYSSLSQCSVSKNSQHFLSTQTTVCEHLFLHLADISDMCLPKLTPGLSRHGQEALYLSERKPRLSFPK